MKKTNSMSFFGLELNRIDGQDVFSGGLHVLGRLLIIVSAVMIIIGDYIPEPIIASITGWAFAGFGFTLNRQLGLYEIRGLKARVLDFGIPLTFGAAGFLIGMLLLWLLEKSKVLFN